MWADKAKLREIRFKVGLVFQYPEYQLFEETVYRDIAFGPKNMGLSEEEVDKRVRQAAAFVNVTEEMMNKSPFELSAAAERGYVSSRPDSSSELPAQHFLCVWGPSSSSSRYSFS